ncbi:MAG: hypothetical protein HZB16_01920 [Armatimonadetes bacterium]|nr:hypothetical protein [Armatimonadota bacterium]
MAIAAEHEAGPPWSLSIAFVELCVDVIRQAHLRLRANPPAALQALVEESLTQNIAVRAEDICVHSENGVQVDLEVPEVTAQTLRGAAASRRKDLVFTVPQTRRIGGLYLAWEAKRLGSPQKYMAEGMMRFVTGGYSQNVDRAGMLGYVQDGPIDQQAGAINAAIQGNSSVLGAADRLVDVGGGRGDLYTSTHERQGGLGAITLTHLMLDCTG